MYLFSFTVTSRKLGATWLTGLAEAIVQLSLKKMSLLWNWGGNHYVAYILLVVTNKWLSGKLVFKLVPWNPEPLHQPRLRFTLPRVRAKKRAVSCFVKIQATAPPSPLDGCVEKHQECTPDIIGSIPGDIGAGGKRTKRPFKDTNIAWSLFFRKHNLLQV